MKVYDFTEPELVYYSEFANFSPQEDILFNLRKKNVPLEKCAEIMHCEMTTVKKISRKVNKKIIQLTDCRRMDEWIERVYWPRVLRSD